MHSVPGPAGGQLSVLTACKSSEFLLACSPLCEVRPERCTAEPVFMVGHSRGGTFRHRNYWNAAWTYPGQEEVLRQQ